MKNVDEVSLQLLKNGFIVKAVKGSFDILARKGSRIILLKTLKDANSITEQHASEMKKIASVLHASPIIIEGDDSHLMDNVVYSRSGIFAMNQHTFENALSNRMPFVRSEHSGLTVRIDGSRLRELRGENDLSLGALSDMIGVSSRMILKYENENSAVSIQKTSKMYSLFGQGIFQSINVFERRTGDIESRHSSVISSKYSSLGFCAHETRRVPFDIIARRDDDIILTAIGDKPSKDIDAISHLLEVDDLAIFEVKRPKDIVSIKKEDFLELEDARDLIRILHE